MQTHNFEKAPCNGSGFSDYELGRMEPEIYDLIKDIVECDSFFLIDLEKLDYAFLDNWINRIQNDDVFHSYLEYFCYQKHIPVKQVINHLEKAIIIWALSKNDGTLKKTARFLDVEYATLSRKMARYSIHAEKIKNLPFSK